MLSRLLSLFYLKSFISISVCSLAVLEGIAISSNPDYKVLGSTYPWIARKVLSDSSPQLKSSLQNLLYEVKTDLFSYLSCILSIMVPITLKLLMLQYVHLISQQKDTIHTQSTIVLIPKLLLLRRVFSELIVQSLC